MIGFRIIKNYQIKSDQCIIRFDVLEELKYQYNVDVVCNDKALLYKPSSIDDCISVSLKKEDLITGLEALLERLKNDKSF